jgi:hypothetical protein
MGKTRICKWFAELKSGVSSAEDSERAGRPSPAEAMKTVDRVTELVLENSRNSILAICNMLGILFASDRAFGRQSENASISSKFVHRLLLEEHNRVNACQVLQQRMARDHG